MSAEGVERRPGADSLMEEVQAPQRRALGSGGSGHSAGSAEAQTLATKSPHKKGGLKSFKRSRGDYAPRLVKGS